MTFAVYVSAQDVKVTTITINNARQTSYSKSEETGNETIVLEGSVELEVKKDSASSTIKADRITYDRVTEMLYAEGSVEITSTNSAFGEETTTADSLLLNTSTLEGIFDGGKVIQSQNDSLNLPSGSTLIVFSKRFGKTSNDIIAFKNSSLTFCDEDDPHWRIDATRTWLLPGGEFAFFNALLYVGNVPVMYLPAFYYPKDELIFNPVFSYRRREGYSIQTTTYIWGRKPLDSSSSSSTSSSTTSDKFAGLYNFIKPTKLKEQVREGLILHNLDQDYTGSTSEYAKIMADWYSKLGLMVGFDTKFSPAKKYLTDVRIQADIGLSNTVFLDTSTYNYNIYSSSGVIYKDEASFLGIKTPFRYSGDLELTLSNPFSMKLSLPIYSDPFYNYDFKTNRSENMDWIAYFLENTTSTETTEAVTVSEVSSYMWQLTTSSSPNLPDFIKPYISSFSVNTNSYVNLASKSASTKSMTYKGITPTDNWSSYSPTRKFYYPSLITPLSVNMSISGTLFSWPL
ncbi:MAG: LPS-assembly protein LptD, partial [Treponema sp.]|nr:LPS-assembly protein LptD [Treponema sp.]